MMKPHVSESVSSSEPRVSETLAPPSTLDCWEDFLSHNHIAIRSKLPNLSKTARYQIVLCHDAGYALSFCHLAALQQLEPLPTESGHFCA
jgi:hypothetical protein